MRNMSADGYAPKSASKPFRLLKQALKWGMAQDLITKNPCDFCKPPKRVKTPINALPREERTHMLELARRAQPALLGIAIELALTTGTSRGERVSAAYLAEAEVEGLTSIRYDIVSLLVTGTEKARSCATTKKRPQRREVTLKRLPRAFRHSAGRLGSWKTWAFLMTLVGIAEVFSGSVGIAADHILHRAR